jgi:hypothetical protein
VEVTSPASHSTGRLLAFNPDMAKFLSVVTLPETSINFVYLYPDCNIATA